MDDRFCYRTPLLPLPDFTALGVEVETVRGRIRELLARKEIQDAIFIASPDLHASLAVWHEQPDSAHGRQIERALIRYVSRMAGRATPFGAFSGISVGTWSDETRVEIEAVASHHRHTRLDHDYLSALCGALRADPQLRQEVTYVPNSTLYGAGRRIRYIEERLRNGVRSHHLVSVDPSDELDVVLQRSREGARRDELVRHLYECLDGVSADEVEAYVDQLIDSQILVSGVAPAVSGEEAARSLIATLAPMPAGKRIADVLERVESELRAIDRDGLGVPPERYLAVASRLEALPAKVDLKRLFQVDLAKLSGACRLHRRVADDVAKGIVVLHRMTRSAESPALVRFRDAFVDRYDTREIPLVEALDEESGIGFGTGTDASPLLGGIGLGGGKGSDPATPMGAPERHLLRLYANTIARGDDEIVLSDADVEAMEVARSMPLPGALAAIAILVGASAEAVDRGDYRVVLEPAVGPSGMRLVGRFCHLDREVESMVRDHLQREEALRPEAAFAEIAHLPEGRVGNILCRPVLRGFEIPFLGRTGAPADRQIPIQDLMVRVEHGRIVLRSRRLDREVIPRLSTAHNFQRGLGVYRFLCALQQQGTGAAQFSWGPLDAAPFLPRVTFERLVLSRARWRLFAEDLAPFVAAKDLARQVEAVRALREQRRLPRLVVLVDDDLELPVDFDNPLSVDSFVHAVKSKSSAMLLELLPGPDDLGATGGFTHEIVVTLVRPAVQIAARPHTPPRAVERIPRRLPPGSPWLFAKIYAGAASLDEVLRRVIAPLNAEARAKNSFDRWFFLRYADPDNHLRVRYRGAPPAIWGELLPALTRAVAPLVEGGVVWRVELGTYEREVERYGGPAGIELCEQVFSVDSDAALAIVEKLSGDAAADVRWRLALRGTDRLLDDLGFDLEGKLAVIGRARESFGRELGVDTAAKKQLGKRYRAERQALARLLDRDEVSPHPLAPAFRILDARTETVRSVGAALRERTLSQPIDQIAGSLVHMHINRMLRSSFRAQELVIYDLLQRWYESVRARARGPR